MATYQAPLRDMKFVLHELLDAEREFAALPGFEEVTRDLIDPVLEEAAKLCENVVFPLYRTGDQEGCTFEDGAVRTPSGFRDAYRAFVEGGWNGLSCNPEFGGQGLPGTLSIFVEEMLQSANLAFALYGGLTHGACIAIDKHAGEELRRRYLPKLIEGTWSGVMCLTESHCGTDLGLLRTRAEPAGDGRYRVTGTKIFITGGEQDLSENIVHLVLARLPDAPAGVKGISMFLVPKFIAGEDGSLGERNAVHCGSIEHKMGIKAASTCVMNYDGATGYLIGEPHRGLQAMFSMMNYERIMVGQQGLSLAEVAYQNAAGYARDRLQGRSLKGPAAPDLPADPIIVHPDVRRMLLTTRAYNEGARALIAWTSLADRPLDAPSGSGRPRSRRGRRRTDDPGHQGVLHRLRLRELPPVPAGVRRPRLHRGVGHGAARARRAHRADLRGGERDPRPRPRRPEARDARRAGDPGIHHGDDDVHRQAARHRRAR